jgi:hypothetical protein
MVFDGAMVALASLLLTIFHPGKAFMMQPLGRGRKVETEELS